MRGTTMPPHRWWHVGMLLLWLAGLIATFLGATFSVISVLLLGALVVVSSIVGYAATGGSQSLYWRTHLISMLPLGIFMLVHPLVDWHNGVPQTWWSMPLGLIFLLVASWGLGLGRWAQKGDET